MRTTIAAVVAFTLVWIALAALRPETTYHLAPGLLPVVYTYLRAQEPGHVRRTPSHAVVDACVGAFTTLGVLLSLATAGLLQGPVLFGGGPVGEGLIVAAVGTAVGLAIGLLHRVSHGHR